MEKILGVDFGTKRVGIAGGDMESKIAFPREVIEYKNIEKVIRRIGEICGEEGVKKVVVGLPLDMRDEKKGRARGMLKRVEGLVQKLQTSIGVEVVVFDERLSSFEAENLLVESGCGRFNKSGSRDEVAAQIILQRFFDSNRN